MATASGASVFDRVVRNGRVFVDGSQRLQKVDVGIRDGKVVAIAETLEGGGQQPDIDAEGLLVLPGGVDSHCHIEQKTSSGLTPCGNFHSASVSALCGGTTTVIPFACQFRGERIRDVVAEYRSLAEKSAADYALHAIVTDPTEANAIADLTELFRTGVTSVKLYMTYDALKLSDYDMLEVLALCRKAGAMTMVHAESHDMIRWITDRLLKADCRLPKNHAVARHPIAEKEATHRAISFAEFVGTPLLVVHVSNPEAANEIALARQRGLPIFAETCPQYLALTKKCLCGTPGDEFAGAKFLCSPPLRDEASQDGLWAALRAGSLQVLSSDHSAYRFEDNGSGGASKTIFGRKASFNKVPMGLPGLETRLSLVFSMGVTDGRLGDDDGEAEAPPDRRFEARVRSFVALSSSNPAKLYGLYPRKGAIAVGSDADLTLWDPSGELTISKQAEVLHDDLDYTPYEGIRVRGLPVCTLSRGELVFRRAGALGAAEEFLAAPPGRGEWCACGRPDLLGWKPADGDEWPSDVDPVLRRASELPVD